MKKKDFREVWAYRENLCISKAFRYQKRRNSAIQNRTPGKCGTFYFWDRGHFLTGGDGTGGYAIFVWQERARTRATQMTHMPSLKPLSLLCQIKNHCVIVASFACHRGKKRAPHFGPPVWVLPCIWAKIRESETTIKIKFALSGGGGCAGGQGGNCPKTLFFMGNVMTIKFWKWNFYCREILLSWRRLLKKGSICHFSRFSVEPPRNYSGVNFGLKWFRFRPESQSYRPKVGVADQKSERTAGETPQNPNRIAQKRAPNGV